MRVKVLEANYGGAFDIATNEYFTRDDINSAAEEVLNHINETFYDKYVVGGTWLEGDNWIINIQPEDGRFEIENSIKIDMRRIRNPLDLKRKYASELAAKIIADIKEYQAEETQALSESKDDFKVDDEVYVMVSNRRGTVTKVFDDKVEVEMPPTGIYPARTDVFYKEDVEHLKVKNSIGHNWEKVATKSVYDSDGFLTDYTWYRDLNSDLHIFVFGDNDIYGPDIGYADFETENMKEAADWFENYEGFVDDEDDDSYEVDDDLFESVMHPDCKVKQFDDKAEAYEFARECKGSIESVIDDNHNWQHYVFYKDCITEEITADDEPVHISSSIEDLNAFCRGLGDACKHLSTEGDCCNYRGYVIEFIDDNYYVYLEEA